MGIMELVASLFATDNYTAVKKMMDVSAMRHAAIASNIANVSTPGYKRVDLSKSFEDELKSRIGARDTDAVVAAMPRTQVVELGDTYLHATASSVLFGFVDDLELYADQAHGLLQARSVSRLGDSDLGVNGRRLAALENQLKG